MLHQSDWHDSASLGTYIHSGSSAHNIVVCGCLWLLSTLEGCSIKLRSATAIWRPLPLDAVHVVAHVVPDSNTVRSGVPAVLLRRMFSDKTL